MAKKFTLSKPAMNITMVGFGQAGSRIVDELGKYQTAEGKGQQTYNCFALNSNDGDLDGLKYIDPANRVSLGMGGLGKNPEKAIKLLYSDKTALEKMENFITKKLNTNDDNAIFFAGLGGGTGTATILKAITDFHNHYNKPKIEQVLKAMVEKLGDKKYKENKGEFHRRAFQIAEENFRKIGVVACVPLRKDGPDVLRQVNKFAQDIWELGNDVTKSVAWVNFPDNQLFFEKFQKLPQSEKQTIDNYRDYANKEIAETLHEINVAANIGGTSIVFDSQDLKRAWTEHKGCLILSKHEVPVDTIKDGTDITKHFNESFICSNLHGKVNLITKGGEVSKVHHVGLLAVIDKSKKGQFGNGGFLENAVEELHQSLPISGTVFSGYVENEDNDGKVTVYSFYKASVLPERLETGLVEEYEQYKKNNQDLKFAKATIKTIEEDSIYDNDAFEDIGIDFLDDSDTEKEKEEEVTVEDALKDFDFTFK